ncbi:hypothetical protein E2C01_025648 [Portunus trituberculatus]|uniref:Uncharacterized protein n=1 Tax=Portunus trituberculatus TaxID=210409 RepID=A0A5B7EFZ8_PORTR|nr:hypothetical protein [Portunus trituberculatus]
MIKEASSAQQHPKAVTLSALSLLFCHPQPWHYHMPIHLTFHGHRLYHIYKNWSHMALLK